MKMKSSLSPCLAITVLSVSEVDSSSKGTGPSELAVARHRPCAERSGRGEEKMMFALVAAHTLVASAFITAPFIPRPSPQRSTPASVVMDAEGDTTELKETLLQKAAEFKAGQQALWQAETETAGAPLGAGSLANIDLTEESLSALRDDVIAAIEALAATNPNPTPLQGWRTPEGCGLQGAWSLLFTTGADATFKPGKQGAATTYQEIDSRKGSDKKAELTSSSNRRHVILRGIVFLHGREELPR